MRLYMSNRNDERSEIFGQGPAMPTRNIMKDDFGFEVPVEVVPLPSGGITYDVEDPLHGQNTLEIKSMTAKDEDILTSRALIKKGTVITHLLKSCIMNKGVDPGKMLSGDRNAVMIALRVTGYGPEYKVEVDCPECGERSKQEFDLSEMPIKALELQPVAVGANVFEFKLPVTKMPVRFKFLTGADEQEMMTIAERKKKKGFSGETAVTARLSACLIEVNGIKDKVKIDNFVRNMPARDSLALRKYLDDNEPGIDMKSWMDCPHCTATSEVNLPLGASFFWPDSE